jgi:hypothetical protein
MESIDALVVNERGAALRALMAKHPYLFSPTQVSPGLEAVIEAGDEGVGPSMLARLCGNDGVMEAGDGKYWLQAVVHGASFTMASGANGVFIGELSFLTEPEMAKLADGVLRGVVKRQNVVPGATEESDDYDKTNSFVREIVVSRLLNALVTSFVYTATPHFASFMGSFRLRNRLYGIYERGAHSLRDMLPQGDTYWRFAAFQVIFTLSVAAYSCGYRHGDLHFGNILVRSVKKTRYDGKVWAYKIRGQAVYLRFPPTVHLNTMVEIIYQGGAIIAPNGNQDWARFFCWDVAMFLNSLAYELMDIKKDGPLVEQIRATAASLFTHRNPKVDAFAATWFDTLSFLWADLVTPGAVPNDAVAVAIAPADTVADRAYISGVPDEQLLRELDRIWSPPQGLKRPYSKVDAVVCAVCRDTARYKAAKDETLLFCGTDCYRVHCKLM